MILRCRHLICFLFWLDRISILSVMKVHLTTTLCDYYSSIFWTFTWFNTSWCMSSWNKIICLRLSIIDTLFSIDQNLLWITYQLWKCHFFFSRIIAISLWIIINIYLNSRNSIYSIHSLHILSKCCWILSWTIGFLNCSIFLSILN